jgi:hypothetical protein
MIRTSAYGRKNGVVDFTIITIRTKFIKNPLIFNTPYVIDDINEGQFIFVVVVKFDIIPTRLYLGSCLPLLGPCILWETTILVENLQFMLYEILFNGNRGPLISGFFTHLSKQLKSVILNKSLYVSFTCAFLVFPIKLDSLLI